MTTGTRSTIRTSELLDTSELEAQTEPAGTQLSLEEQIKLVLPGAEEV